MNPLHFTNNCNNIDAARIGGGAFIGGIVDWPKHENGQDLTLITSIPMDFIKSHIDNYLPQYYLSVFSYYSSIEYFLDEITYHGDPEEKAHLERTGATQVFIHKKGSIIYKDNSIPAREILISDTEHSSPWQGSGIGIPPGFLQNEGIDFTDKNFVLQFYSSDFPAPYKDIFGLTDSVAYLYVDIDLKGGVFFAQST